MTFSWRLALRCTILCAAMTGATRNPLWAADPPNLPVVFNPVVSYPSLAPLPVFQVQLTQFAVRNDFDAALPGSFVVTDAKGHAAPIARLDFPIATDGKDKNGNACSKKAIAVPEECLDRSIAYIVLRQSVKNGDSFVFTIFKSSHGKLTQDVLAKTAKPVAIKSYQSWTMAFTPQSAPGETLRNSAKRDVGQLNATFGVPEVFGAWKFARTYLSSTHVISTDGKDSNSKISATAGMERSLLSRWYLPAHIETIVQGDQTAQNLSWLAGFGVQTILPWAFTQPALYNRFVQLPLSPTISIDAQYERRINRDAATLKKFPDINDFRLAPALTWKPIRFLPGPLHQDTVDFEITLKGWYLPFDQTKSVGGTQRLEGAGDISLLFPLSKLSPTRVSRCLTTGDANKSRIRLKYSAGANDANGYKHARQFTYGIELTTGGTPSGK